MEITPAYLKHLHSVIEDEIEERLASFDKNTTREKILKEFFFCMLTPQCKAQVCWDNVERLYPNGTLLQGSSATIAESFQGVRFKNNKAAYIVESRYMFSDGGVFFRNLEREKDPLFLREYLVSNVRGMGLKESSHFLRNIGRGRSLAILDRHILNGLKTASVINDIPGSLTAGRYLGIEEKMRSFARKISIPMAHLDFVFWYIKKGEIFK